MYIYIYIRKDSFTIPVLGDGLCCFFLSDKCHPSPWAPKSKGSFFHTNVMRPTCTHIIHVWHIYLHFPWTSTIHVGKYTLHGWCGEVVPPKKSSKICMAFFHPMPRFLSKKLPKKASLRDYLYLVGETSNIFFSTTTLGRWTHFDDHIFQMGWFNHQPFLTQSLHDVFFPKFTFASWLICPPLVGTWKVTF